MVVKMSKNISLKNLALFNFMLNHLGMEDFKRLREVLSQVKEEYDSDGKSYFFNALINLNLKISNEKLAKYDENIISYLVQINEVRSKKIRLKYFQYIAVLFTEIYLDNLCSDSDDFLASLNKYIISEEKNKNEFIHFKKKDMDKLAYWMATGSGKTLIMHINYLQYNKYNKKPLDNIILITPKEDLSNQHLKEFRRSNISAKRFDKLNSINNQIQIIEIQKLTVKKEGTGASIEVCEFEGNNLIFVDEGHKGITGNAWKTLRDEISKIGFTFEYSATFDEAISPKKDKIIEEYSKAIIMDYSYKYFYYDGFGKEFTVMNLKNTEYATNEHKEFILLTNLLSFYQQMKFYNDNKTEIEYLFEKPLWIFIGSKVAKGNKTLSDLEFLVIFFDNFLQKEEDYCLKIEKILNNNLKLEGEHGEVNLAKLLNYIKNEQITSQDIYRDILKLVFNSDNSQKLKIWTIKNAPGEIGLKVSDRDNYFALIYIGDISPFKKNIEENYNIIFQDDILSDPLFKKINDYSSPINVLIGSKMFIEGWNSFRVSSMGLLNMGTSKGSQIIQLFGRGIRLKGYKNSMKRTSELVKEQIIDKDFVQNLKILETLSVFGINADYMDNFRKALNEEGIIEKETINIEIKKNEDFLKKNLYTLKLKEGLEFQELLNLDYNQNIMPIIDLRPKFEDYGSSNLSNSLIKIEENSISFSNYLEFIDWEKIYFELYNFKNQKGLYNLYFTKQDLVEIINKDNYKILLDKTFNLDSFSQISFLETLIVVILKQYVTNFFNISKREWVTENMEYHILKENDNNFQDYKIRISQDEFQLFDLIKKLSNDSDRLYNDDIVEISTLIFDRHLYQPLIIGDKLETIPKGLNKGEKKFVEDLRDYFRNNKKQDYKFYLFRNLSKKGVGIFTETNNFYPDFILWALNENVQKIVFIDPKGLVHGYADKMAKISVKNTLETIENKLGRKDIKLYSIIMAVENTKLSQIIGLNGMKTKEDFERNNVLFQDDPEYIYKLILKIEN
jgi:superfamily II DNA or RNA helicase